VRDGTDPMIRVLIIDDNAVFRQGMKNLFASIEDIAVCGVAGDGATGVNAVLELQPDVALMDLAMPGMTGIEATGRLTAAAPHIGIVVMTMLEDDDAVVQALRAGARGYIVKGAQQHEILDAIRSVHAGRAVIGATVARQLAALVSGSAPNDPFPDLTARERDVLDALTAGASTTQIADRLGLSDKTVRNHISNILTKLEVVDRTQAILKARAAGLGR
jgi:DNA-binding NarL/FixJ family response regulator